ncbi:MAG: type II secretion system F family protein [Propionibacteriaceae bacterium]|nr:type II secretion system F family protein [Propionibacteriaceae bacterium]
MDVVVAACCGLLLVTGSWLIALGIRRDSRPPAPSSPPLRAVLARRWEGLGRTRQIWVLAALGAGLGTYLVTGWPIWLLVVPAAVIGLPALLGEPPNHEVELLAALDRWVRSLASSLPTGKSIRDAIRATRAQTPLCLQRPVGLLLARLDDRWPVRDAFFAMADELNSADADAILAALALASERGGVGAVDTLRALSDDVHERLRAIREIATERAKPRIVVRHVTFISATLIVAALLFGGDFFAPYRTPLGSAILLALLLAYAGTLAMLYRMSQIKPRARQIAWRPGGDHD